MTAFATPAELVTFAETTEDVPRMTLLLDLASDVIRRYTGQRLDVLEGDQVEFGPTDRESLFLPERPVNAVSAVEVSGVVTLEFDWTRWGVLQLVPDGPWTDGAVVTYDHGYAPDSPEMGAVKAITLAAASRAFTMNERSASEAIGPTLMEAAGYSPEVFLTQGERMQLWDLGAVPVG